MNFKVNSVRTIRQMFAIIAVFAMIFSPFANVQLASADHDPYGGVEMKKIILCHWDESGAFKSSGDVSVNAISGHTGHAQDIIPPFHYKEGKNSASFAGQNWNAINADIWNGGLCDGDGILPVLGCMDVNATNYNVNATVSDGSCTYPPVPVPGCMDSNATNYNVNATVSDGSCTYPDPDPEDVLGCTDENANNYNPEATANDDSCTYDPLPVPGCMDENANNYNENATVSNDSCTYDPLPVPGCMDSTAINFNQLATVDNNTCVYENEEPELCEVTVVSDTTNTVVEKGDEFAAALAFIHSAWTASIDGATWIWGDNPVVNPTVAETQTFEKIFNWNGPVTDALLDIASDNTYVVTLNGNVVANSGSDSNFTLATQDNDLDVSSAIVQGTNTLSIAVLNEATENDANPQNNPAGLMYRLDVTGTNEDCDAPATQNLYQVSGQVWHDENKNDERDINDEEDAEDILAGWVITITDGEGFEATTTSDAFGNYSFMVPAGNYTVTQTMQEGWEFTFPNDGIWEVCVPVVCDEVMVVTLIDEVMNFIIPTAHAAVAAANNALNFGNVRTAPGFAQASYGGNGTRVSLRDGGGINDDVQPEGQVLGEATSTLPVGAPNTGAGGASASLQLHVVAAILATRRGVKNGN